MTTLSLMIGTNVIAYRRDIECSREFTIQHDTGVSEPTFKSYGLTANQATMAILSTGMLMNLLEWVIL